MATFVKKSVGVGASGRGGGGGGRSPVKKPNNGNQQQQRRQWLSSDMGPLKIWFCRNKAFIKKSDKKTEETHLLLDGGRIHVNPESEPAFFSAYAEAVKKADKLYVVERRTTPYFNYFIEFDYRTKGFVDGTLLARILGSYLQREIVSKLFRFPDGHNGEEHTFVTVSYCPCAIDPKGDGYKTGIHYNWHFPVTIETAKLVRMFLVRALSVMSKDQLGVESPCESWSKVVDPAVYNHCGLRMLYSRKSAPCDGCGGHPFKKKRLQGGIIADEVEVCSRCNGSGKTDLGRVYQLLAVLRRDGEEMDDMTERLKKDVLTAVKYTTIRRVDNDKEKKEVVLDKEAFGNESNYKALADAVALEDKPGKGRKVKVDQVLLDETKEAAEHTAAFLGCDHEKLPMEEISMGDERSACIAEFIKRMFPHSPIVVNVKKLNPSRREKESDDVPVFYIANTRSKFCINKNDEHTGSYVYYVVTMDGVYQKCFSKKDIVYSPSGKTCSAFRSAAKKMSPSYLSILFTKYSKRKEKKAKHRKQLMEAIYGKNEETLLKEKEQEEEREREQTRAAVAAEEEEAHQMDEDMLHPAVAPPIKRRRLQKGGRQQAQTQTTVSASSVAVSEEGDEKKASGGQVPAEKRKKRDTAAVRQEKRVKKMLPKLDVPRGGNEFAFCLAKFPNVRGCSRY